MNQKLLNYLNQKCEAIKMPKKWWRKLEAEVACDVEAAVFIETAGYFDRYTKKYGELKTQRKEALEKLEKNKK